jgi:hypothetical protein
MAESKIVVQVILDNKALQTGSAQTKKVLDDVSKSTSNFQKSVSKTNKELKQNKTQAGLNNAILLETGRLASDASYGFTAMANNLSQLTSLFGSFVQTSGGLTASLKDLGKSIMGTGGALLAVQLLIGALQSERVVKFLRSLSGLNPVLKELLELTDNYSKNVETLVGNFDLYTRKIMDSTVSEEQKVIALKKLNKEYPDFNASILITANNTDEASDAIERYIKKLKEQALSQAAIQEFNEVQGELAKELFTNQLRQVELQDDIARDEANIAAERAKFGENLRADEKLTLAERTEAYRQNIRINKNTIENLKNESDEITKQYKRRLDIIDNFIILSDDENKKTSKRLNGIKKLYDKFLKDLARARKEAQKKISEFQKRQDELEILSAEKIYAQRLYGLTTALKKEEITEEEFAKKKLELDRFFVQAEIDNLNGKLKEALTAETVNANEVLRIKTALFDKLTELLNLSAEEEKATFTETLKYYNELSQELFSAVGSMYDAEIQREERKTTLLNNQLQERLNNEKLTAEQREAINKQIEANEVKLAKKRDELAEKQFKMNKAASIANALVSTYEAGAGVLADTKGGSFARIAGMILVISTGLAQVAAIARQQFVPTALPSGSAGGAGGGGGMEAPDFNIVGASGQSQLAQTIAGAEAQPVRAFVVGKDVSTQQELDRNITNTASFG